MSAEYNASNPYLAPARSGFVPPVREKAPGRLLAPAMALIAVSGVGLAFSLFNFAMSFGAAHVDPQAPEVLQEIQRGSVGPVATALQGGFGMLNLFILICGIQMMNLKSWGMGVAGSVLAMVNVGSCCCAAGIPVGIWSLVILMSPEIITIFTAAKGEQLPS